MTIARETFNLIEHDNMTLAASNLDAFAEQKTNGMDGEESTTWIFSDNSALKLIAPNDWEILDFVEFSADNIRLN